MVTVDEARLDEIERAHGQYVEVERIHVAGLAVVRSRTKAAARVLDIARSLGASDSEVCRPGKGGLRAPYLMLGLSRQRA